MGFFSRKPTAAEWFSHIVENELPDTTSRLARERQAYEEMVDHGLTPQQAARAYQDYLDGRG